MKRIDNEKSCRLKDIQGMKLLKFNREQLDIDINDYVEQSPEVLDAFGVPCSRFNNLSSGDESCYNMEFTLTVNVKLRAAIVTFLRRINSDMRSMVFVAELDNDDMSCLLDMVNDLIFNLGNEFYLLKSYLE